MAGLTPVLLLEEPLGLHGHQDQIRGSEPEVVRTARALSTATKGNKMRGK